MIGIGINNIFFKRFSRIYGPELVVNGGFDSGDSWTATNNSSISGGVARLFSSGGEFTKIEQTGILTISLNYRLTYTIVSWVSGDARLASSTTNPILITTAGTHTIDFEADLTDLSISRVSGITDITFDNVSVKEIL